MDERRWMRVVSGVCAAALLAGAAACSGVSVTSVPPTSSAEESKAPPVGSETETAQAPSSAEETEGTDGAGGATTTPGPDESEPLASPNPVHPSWAAEEGTWRVYGVGWGDVLNVRSGAGPSYPPVAWLAPDAAGLTVYAPLARVGEAIWQPVAVEGGSGWVNTRFLRPDPAANPEIVGTEDAALSAAVKSVVEALEQRDYGRLSALVHPSRGLLISPDAFIGGDEVVLSAAAVAGAFSDTEQHVWGYTDGEGAPISLTIAQQLAAIAGSRAITSVQRIGYDRTVQTGNSIDNVGDKFPGTRMVEYNYAGSQTYGGIDWSSVRFVFDTAGGGDPRLLALVQDTWSI